MAALVATPAGAQSSQDQLDRLTEIVVTARRVEEKLIDVPAALTAIGTAEIEARGIANLDDIAAATPGLQFSNVIGEFLPAPVIRGVAPIDILAELNTAVFVDGVYVSGREGINFNFLDLERIEVLKGPQAAAYGRNAFSGAINYVTKRPSEQFEGKANFTVGNRGKRSMGVSFSGPLTSTLRGRVALLADDWDGSYDNQNPNGADLGGAKFKTAQGMLVFAPSETFEGELSLYLSDDQIDNSALSAVAANCENRRDAVPTLSSRLLNYCGELPTVNSDSLNAVTGATGEDRDLIRSHLKLHWNIGAHSLDALTGYSKLDQSFFVDGSRNSGETTIFTYQPAPAPFNPTFGGTVSGPVQQFTTGLLQIGGGSHTKELSQELRFNSDREQRFRYSLGAYYYDTESKAGEDGVIATRPLPANFGSFCLVCVAFPPTFTTVVDFAPFAGNATFLEWFTDPAGGSRYADIFISKQQAISGFFQTEYDFGDRWTGGIEARYTDEERRSINRDSAEDFKDSWGLVSWRGFVRFKPTDNMSWFAALASSDKSGGFDSATVQFVSNPGVDVFIPGSFDPEKLVSAEIGFKGEFNDGRFNTEIDVYHMDWKDIVIPQVVSQVNGQDIITPTAFSVNAGDATIKGFEFQIDARPIDTLRLGLGVAYIDATYDRAALTTFTQFPTYAPTGDVSGNKVLRQSDWQATGTARYGFAVNESTDWYVRGDLAYRGKQFADASNQTIVPSSLNLNMSLGLENERWQVELWGRNLTHEDAPTGAFRDVYFTNTLPSGANSGGTFFPFRWTVSHPRLTTYGLTFRLKF
ncbi:MAG: TonB-dependent receptor [Steroidobacteraceae bacterium]